MTQEEKELLIKDLCARVSNGGYVKVSVESTVGFGKDCVVVDIHNLSKFVETTDFHLENVKPYLRPMESMTEEELKEFYIIEDLGEHPVVWNKPQYNWHFTVNGIDWLNEKGFDYRGLIPKGLALEALDGMYNN